MSGTTQLKQPRQQRSIASTARMLDAAESLFANGGPDALTVEAVIAEAGTSAGSFYARFGDRSGLLAALHERFLARLSVATEAILAEAIAQPALDRAVRVVVTRSLAVAHENHASLAFFVLHRSADERLRRQGVEANRGFAKAFSRVVAHHEAEVRHPKPAHAADVAFRILFALLVQQVMFRPQDITGRPMADKTLAEELTRSLVLFLTVPPA